MDYIYRNCLVNIWPEGETVTGEVFKLRRAIAIVHLPKAGVRLEGYADTFRGNTENLVGLDFLYGLRLLLDGHAQKRASLNQPQAPA